MRFVKDGFNKLFSEDYNIIFLLFLTGILGLSLTKFNKEFILIFAVGYVSLVYLTYSRKSLWGLFLCATLSSSVLAFRFKYLTWGDPWFEYSMILEIMNNGMLSQAFYPDQEPALHVLMASSAIYTKLGAMFLQKFLVPLLSVLSIVALYKISKQFFNREIAITSALLLSVGTAYVHWTSQAVCESLGIPLGILGVYFSYRSFKDLKYLPVALLLIIGLILAHHLSALIFLVWWNSFALAYLYLQSKDRKENIVGLLISIISLLVALTWWHLRLPNIYHTVDKTACRLFHTSDAIYLLPLMLLILYLIPVVIPRVADGIRSLLAFVLRFRKAIYLGIVLISLIFASIALVFLLGKSFFVLNYPPLFFSNGVIMIFLAIAGLYKFLNLEKMPILAWCAGISLMLIFSIIGIYHAEDPLRFIEFIYPPLCIIAAVGFVTIFRNLKSQHRAVIMSLICLFSLVFAFPSPVFWGQNYPPTDIRHDDRGWIIEHPKSEIMAIDLLNANGEGGQLYTDRYVGYASMQLDNFSIDFNQRLDPDRFSGQDDFALVTSRMMKYAEFGEWLLKENHPMKEDEVKKIDEKTSRIYDNGESQIYGDFKL